MAGLVVVDFVELVEEAFEGVHDFEAEEVVNALEATDADAFVENVEGFESEDFLFLLQVIKSKGRLDKNSAFGTGEGNDLIEEVAEERVAMFILEAGHGDVVIIVEFLVTNFLENVEVFFHIGVAVDEFLELFIEHF